MIVRTCVPDRHQNVLILFKTGAFFSDLIGKEHPVDSNIERCARSFSAVLQTRNQYAMHTMMEEVKG